MQLPPADEIVMVAGIPPIRARKARYYADRRFTDRVLPPPKHLKLPKARRDEWTIRPPIAPVSSTMPMAKSAAKSASVAGPERRKTPELTETPKPKPPETIPLDFGPASTELEERVKRLQGLQRAQQQTAQQASLDPNDGIDL